MQGLWMEQESDAVALGRVIDETAFGREKQDIEIHALSPDGIRLVGRIDRGRFRDGLLTEVKKSPALAEAHRWQVRFYLWLCALTGAHRADGRLPTARIAYPAQKRHEDVSLGDADRTELARITRELRDLSRARTPPPRIDRRKLCHACAFEELCYG
jgi:CRISPR-associated exonuclease Cas4